jgi:hypothetical protein
MARQEPIVNAPNIKPRLYAAVFATFKFTVTIYLLSECLWQCRLLLKIFSLENTTL